jgi:serralysin
MGDCMAKGSADVQALTGLEQTLRWNTSGPLGTPVVVTYSFSARKPAYDSVGRADFTPFGEAHKAYAREALDAWASVSGLTFIEVPEKAGGQIRFAMQDMTGMTNATGGPVSGFAYYPSVYQTSEYVNGEFVSSGWRQFFGGLGGDVFMNVDLYGATPDAMAPGERGYQILLHEIGHALGFKHPFEGTPVIQDAHNNGSYTVMAYERSMSSTSLGPVDIEAIRLYYGSSDFGVTFDRKKLTIEITGTAGANTIQGTELADTLHGLGKNDTLLGGPRNDKLFGGSGNDRLEGEDGNDLLVGGAGKDQLIGGAGVDTASYADAKKRIVILVDKPKAGSGDAKGDTFDGIEKFVGSRFADRIEAGMVEKASIAGGAGNDLIVGSIFADTLDGGAGNDTLRGGDGADRLTGGNGRDVLMGNVGRDLLVGGKGPDSFAFRKTDDSTLAKSGQTVIKDFRQAENDKIVVKAIDANTTRVKNNTFVFIGDEKFSDKAGELRFANQKGATYVYADVNGDGRADMGIKLAGTFTLTKGDFVL